jgi:hypothetical protein
VLKHKHRPISNSRKMNLILLSPCTADPSPHSTSVILSFKLQSPFKTCHHVVRIVYYCPHAKRSPLECRRRGGGGELTTHAHSACSKYIVLQQYPVVQCNVYTNSVAGVGACFVRVQRSRSCPPHSQQTSRGARTVAITHIPAQIYLKPSHT